LEASANVWVQLRSIQYAQDEAGNTETYYPGDWVKVGKQTALRWIASGEAWALAEKIAALLPEDSGVVIRGPKEAVSQLGNLAGELKVAFGEPRPEFAHTLCWDAVLKLPAHLIGSGFHLLERGWQLVVPLCDYELLALRIGSEEDRERAKQIIPDLRVPVYQTGLMFVQRCPDTLRLFAAWKEQRAGISDERLAFLCALYLSKPLVLALPVTWLELE